jgi:hypothetical protein
MSGRARRATVTDMNIPDLRTAVHRAFAPAARPGRVGVEIELIPVADGARPEPARLAAVLDPGFAAEARPRFEPGGQLELSPAPRPVAIETSRREASSRYERDLSVTKPAVLARPVNQATVARTRLSRRNAAVLAAAVILSQGVLSLADAATWKPVTAQPRVSWTAPVVPTALHGSGFLANARLGRITEGTVPCVHAETAATARCVFTPGSGSWLESAQGDFARVAQPISLDGRPGGEYVVASEVSAEGTVPAVAPTGHDAEGVPAGNELAQACVVETMTSSTNVTGQRLVNYATREVPTSSYPHPDDAHLMREYWDGTHWIYYYSGEGAALNDVNGTERDAAGVYLPGSAHCHVVWSNGYEVSGAKRPNTKAWPAPGVVVPWTAIVWRPVNPDVAIGN